MTEQDDTPEKFVADLRAGNAFGAADVMADRAEALFAKEREIWKFWNRSCGEQERKADLLQAVAALDENFGYEADWDHFKARIDGWYCRGPNCSQPRGKPHLDGCPVGRYEAEGLKA